MAPNLALVHSIPYESPMPKTGSRSVVISKVHLKKLLAEHNLKSKAEKLPKASNRQYWEAKKLLAKE